MMTIEHGTPEELRNRLYRALRDMAEEYGYLPLDADASLRDVADAVWLDEELVLR